MSEPNPNPEPPPEPEQGIGFLPLLHVDEMGYILWIFFFFFSVFSHHISDASLTVDLFAPHPSLTRDKFVALDSEEGSRNATLELSYSPMSASRFALTLTLTLNPKP